MKRLKIGIFGAHRGMDIAVNFMHLDCEIVAVCDSRPAQVEEAIKALGGTAAGYTDFDTFLHHGMDAVVLANYFHEHAPYAIKCFQKGLHVYSECLSNGTMAEGVELLRGFEKSSSIYMLAENYPQMKFNLEMKRICDGGSLGKILYAEGEYNHPADPNGVAFLKTHKYFEKHWRNYLPASYYITHSLCPIMRATGATPKRVSGLAVYAPQDMDAPVASHAGDRVAIVTTQNDDGSVFRVTGCAGFGAHHNSYRICGTNGQIENLRGMGERVMLRYNAWSKPENAEEINFYEPEWNDKDELFIQKSGHGGGDYLTARMFVECLKAGKQPEHPFDIYSAVTMSSVAILAHRSILSGGQPYDVPDFRTEADRKQYALDGATPFYGSDGSTPTIPCCSVPGHKPTQEQLRLYRDVLGL